jgi:regulator of cell morphogenesis and NO signaling
MKQIPYSKSGWVAVSGLLILAANTACVRSNTPDGPLGTNLERRNVIMKTKIDKSITVGDLVVRYPQLRQTLEKLGIDYCCGGKRPLAAAAGEAGLQWDAVDAALTEALAAHPESEATDWNSASLSELTDHILDKHHVFTKEQLVRLDGLLQKVQRAHGEKHGEQLDQLRRLFDGLDAELSAHLLKEEQILFPAIKGIDAFVSGTGPRPVVHCGTIENPIRQMMLEHDHAGVVLADIRRLTGNYRLPADACQTFAALYEGLQALEADLHEHIHLENNILFPKSAEQEATMSA